MIVFATIATSGLGVAPLDSRGESSGLSPDDLNQVLDDRATEAGSSAGLAEACGTYPAPVDTAFKVMLDTLHVDAAEQSALWQRYKTAESSSLAALTKRGSIRCADATSIILCTVHDLARPISFDMSSEGNVAAESAAGWS
jgi:hypothetical protein